MRYELITKNSNEEPRSLGFVELSENAYHGRNLYVDFSDVTLDLNAAGEISDQLVEQFDRPLQVMTESNQKELIEFLLAGGFELRRKCYEREFRLDDLISPPVDKERTLDAIQYAGRGEQNYQLAVAQLFEDYRQKHEAINPLTVDYKVFALSAPHRVCLSMKNGEIESYAFLDGYVGTKNPTQFKEFLSVLLANLFAKYDRILFEADDVDQDAMVLKSLFNDQDESSFDTYIKTDTHFPKSL